MTFPKYLSESELLVATLFKKQHISEGYSESEFHAPFLLPSDELRKHCCQCCNTSTLIEPIYISSDRTSAGKSSLRKRPVILCSHVCRFWWRLFDAIEPANSGSAEIGAKNRFV